jgi:hypothetical protein
MKESGMGGSIVLDDGQTFDEGIETNETSNEKEHAYSIPSDEFAIEPEIEGTSGLAEIEVTENFFSFSCSTYIAAFTSLDGDWIIPSCEKGD